MVIRSRNDLPSWAIVLIVISATIISLICIAIVFCVWRRFRSLESEIAEVPANLLTFAKPIFQVQIDKTILAKLSTQDKSLRYYDLPNLSDEWEIDRRFVGIDYQTKLGQGAFGSVYLGEKAFVHQIITTFRPGAG